MGASKPRPGRSLRKISRTGRRVVLVLVGMAALSSCADSLTAVNERGGERIRIQRAIWEAQQLDQYVFETRRVCFCGFIGWLEVSVSNGSVQSVTALEAEDVPEWATADYPTVDELFDLLEEAVAQDAAQIEVTWHESMGYPESFYIDYSKNIADEELGHDIRSLTPVP